MERRRHGRIACRMECELHLDRRRRLSGTVRDVSEGGLSIQVVAELPEQGESVRVVLKPDRQRAVEINCLVWHGRRLRQLPGAGYLVRIGLVLSDAPPAFFDLVTELASSSAGARGAATARSEDARERRAPLSALARYAVRVKQSGGPRSFRLVVGASDPGEAQERALAEIGEDWNVLEVRAC
jgi:hypothetical protein